MKKITGIIMFFLVFSLGAFMPTLAATEDYEYTKSADNTVTITKYNGNSTELVIPDTIDGGKVTSISNGVFQRKGLTKVELPKDLITIGNSVFRNNALTTLEIGRAHV